MRSGTDEGQSPAIAPDRERVGKAIAIEQRLPQPHIAFGLEGKQRIVNRTKHLDAR